eukprot:6099001-Lingulodinium_polyedra.AAC.1
MIPPTKSSSNKLFNARAVRDGSGDRESVASWQMADRVVSALKEEFSTHEFVEPPRMAKRG